tara:strand:- start:55 stop:987 length:933 start_codon:yes stop_codon:yes gene_type:complete
LRLRWNWCWPKQEIGDFHRGLLAIFCCTLNNLDCEKLGRLENFFELNRSAVVYQEVVVCTKKPLFTLKIFTKRALDPITIYLIEECFEVKITTTKVQKRNWLKASNVKFSPTKIDKFIITSSFYARSVKQDRFSLTIDASLAFGTGHHYSTKFCLELIQELKKMGINPSTIIDVGCGTGILAIALAKLFSSRIIAVDNDSHSVEITKQNIVVNKVVQYVKVYKSTGLVGNHLNFRAKYDLIVANILFKPIKILMRSFVSNLSNRGFLILSGLNITQARQLKEISKQFGLKVIDERKEANWGSLLLQRIDS